MSEFVILYRPVGPEELKLIRETGWTRFPPRLPEQPIFYPVVQEEYAIKIARDWNVKASGAGYVTRFRVAREYLSRFQTHSAGGESLTEYWIPAEDLDDFNRHLSGQIEVVAEFRASAPEVKMDEWVKVYDLAEDQETVDLVQRATLNTNDFGLIPEVALFGSDDWWRAIDDGRIPLCEVSGTIVRVFASGHGDWPEFELESRGDRSRWTRLGEQSLYQEGRQVRVQYVMQKARKHWVGTQEQRQVLRIFIHC